MYPEGFSLADDVANNPTIFGKILRGEIPAQLVHEDEHCVAFRDISPAAPTHILVIPRRLIRSLNAVTAEDAPLLGHLLVVAAQVARDQGVDDSGFRLVINTHEHGGQTVHHLHLHVLGGRGMTWPPG